jgi:hypothetical protein
MHAPLRVNVLAWAGLALILTSLGALVRTARAQDVDTPASGADGPPPVRPSIMFERWEENWSVLADPALRTEPFDDLKYIPLSSSDPLSYLSLGMDLRERYEASNLDLSLVGHGVGH